MSAIQSKGRRGSTLVPNWRWEDPSLDPYELRVAGWLASHADSYLAAFVCRNEIARRTHISRTKVSEAISRLVGLGIIELSNAPTPGGGKDRWVITFDFDAWEARTPHDLARTPHDLDEDATRPSQGRHTSTSVQQREEQCEKAPTARARADSPEIEVAADLCDLMAERIEDLGAKRPNVTKAWVQDMERMIRLDGRDPLQVARSIVWLYTSPSEVAQFWSPNVRSPAKLRSKWDTIAAQVRRDANGSNRHDPAAALVEQTAAEAGITPDELRERWRRQNADITAREDERRRKWAQIVKEAEERDD